MPAAAVILAHEDELAIRIERSAGWHPSEARDAPIRVVVIRAGEGWLVVVANVSVVRIWRSALAELRVENEAVKTLIFRDLGGGYPVEHFHHLRLGRPGTVGKAPDLAVFPDEK